MPFYYVLQTVLTFEILAFVVWLVTINMREIMLLIRTGKEDAEDLKANPKERADAVLAMVFGHKRLMADKKAGWLHVAFLYGFILLGIGHMEVLFSGLTAFVKAFDEKNHEFLYEHVFAWALPEGLAVFLTRMYHLSQDTVAFFVLLAAGIALWRRIGGSVDRLMPRSKDAEIILWFIFSLYVTFFGLVGVETLHWAHEGRIGLTPSHDAQWLWFAPFSSTFGMLLQHLPSSILTAVGGISWWAHLALFLGFACYIPLSKHMHLIFAGPNIYFYRQQRMGLPAPINFETAEKYGTDRITELSWKTMLDTFACTECGRCNDVCPAHLTGKPLKPKKVLHDLKVNLRYDNGADVIKFRDAKGKPLADKAEEEANFEFKKPLIAREEVDMDKPGAVRKWTGTDKSGVQREYMEYLESEGQIHLEETWACTTCAACVAACPVLIDSVPGALIGIRQNMVMMESDFPHELTAAFKGMENQGNPWGVGQDKRTDWTEGLSDAGGKSLDVPVMADIAAEDPERVVEYLFWVGCAGSTDDRAKKVQQSLVRVLKSANVDFAILGCEEKCTGDPARRMGNEYVFNSLAQENIEVMKQYKFKKIFTTCPHCFNSLKNDYKEEFGTNYSVQHHTELLGELLKDKRIPLDLRNQIDEHITYHDPCYLGRYNKVYEQPREALVQIGFKPKEMAKSKESSFCCGAGGGRMWMEEPIGKRVNVDRTEQALSVGAKTIAVGCPFCMTMLTDGTKAKGVEDSVQVKDLAELIAERLKPHMPDSATKA